MNPIILGDDREAVQPAYLWEPTPDRRWKMIPKRTEELLETAVDYQRDNCGKSGSYNDERCRDCGRCWVADYLEQLANDAEWERLSGEKL